MAAAAEYWAQADRDRQVAKLKLHVRLHGGVVSEAMGQDVTHVVLVANGEGMNVSGSHDAAATAADTQYENHAVGVEEDVDAAVFLAALVASCRDVSKVQLRRMRAQLESGSVQVVGPR